MSIPSVFSFQIPKGDLIPGLMTSYLESELSLVTSLTVSFMSVVNEDNKYSQGPRYGYYLITIVPVQYGVTELLKESLRNGILKEFSQYSLDSPQMV